MVEPERAKYGLDIAKAADVNQPIQINNNEIFSIDLGTKALTAKIKALESVKNLNVVEPRLQQINAKISMLEKLDIDRSIHFKTFRFLDDVEKPLYRDKPKRVLIGSVRNYTGHYARHCHRSCSLRFVEKKKPNNWLVLIKRGCQTQPLAL